MASLTEKTASKKDLHASQHVEAPTNVDLESVANQQDEKITFQYIWENKRVLGWCKLMSLTRDRSYLQLTLASRPPDLPLAGELWPRGQHCW